MRTGGRQTAHQQHSQASKIGAVNTRGHFKSTPMLQPKQQHEKGCETARIRRGLSLTIRSAYLLWQRLVRLLRRSVPKICHAAIPWGGDSQYGNEHSVSLWLARCDESQYSVCICMAIFVRINYSSLMSHSARIVGCYLV